MSDNLSMKSLICNILIISFLLPASVFARDDFNLNLPSNTNPLINLGQSPRQIALQNQILFNPNNVTPEIERPHNAPFVSTGFLNPNLAGSFNSPNFGLLKNASGSTAGSLTPNGGPFLASGLNYSPVNSNPMSIFENDGSQINYQFSPIVNKLDRCNDFAADMRALQQAQASLPTCNGARLGESIREVEKMARQMSYYEQLKNRLPNLMEDGALSRDEWLNLVRRLAFERKQSGYYDSAAESEDRQSNYDGSEENLAQISLGQERDFLKDLGCDDYTDGNNCVEKIESFLQGDSSYLDAQIAKLNNRINFMSDNIQAAQNSQMYQDIVKIKSNILSSIEIEKCVDEWNPEGAILASSSLGDVQSSVCQSSNADNIYGTPLVGLVNDINNVVRTIEYDAYSENISLRERALDLSALQSSLQVHGYGLRDEEIDGRKVRVIFYDSEREGAQDIANTRKEDFEAHKENREDYNFDVELRPVTIAQIESEAVAANQAIQTHQDNNQDALSITNECLRLAEHSTHFVYECHSRTEGFQFSTPEPYEDLECRVGDQAYSLKHSRTNEYTKPDGSKGYVSNDLNNLSAAIARDFIENDFNNLTRNLPMDQKVELAYRRGDNAIHERELLELAQFLEQSSDSEVTDESLLSRLDGTGISLDEARRLMASPEDLNVVADNTDNNVTSTTDTVAGYTGDRISDNDDNINDIADTNTSGSPGVSEEEEENEPQTTTGTNGGSSTSGGNGQDSNYNVADERREAIIANGAAYVTTDEVGCRADEVQSGDLCFTPCPTGYLRLESTHPTNPSGCGPDVTAINESLEAEARTERSIARRKNIKFYGLMGAGLIGMGFAAASIGGSATNAGESEMRSRIGAGYAGMYSGGSFVGSGMSGYGSGLYGSTSTYSNTGAFSGVANGFNGLYYRYDPTTTLMGQTHFFPYSNNTNAAGIPFR